MAENNGYSQGDYSFLNNIDKFYAEFSKVVNLNSKCNVSNTCLLTNDIKGLNNTAQGQYINKNNKSVTTSDGISYSYALKPGHIYGISEDDINNTIGRIIVDINGNKKPNKVGRDVFYFYIVNKKGVLPAGANNSSDCIISDTGNSCAGRVLKENAMNY